MSAAWLTRAGATLHRRAGARSPRGVGRSRHARQAVSSALSTGSAASTAMSNIIKVSDDFYNVRSSFNIGPVDIGTQSSLVRRATGKWLMLDSVKLEPDVKAEVDRLTANGADLEAILNVHPFHTVFCKWAHENYPNAALYGTTRHHQKWPDLPWQPGVLDDEEVRRQWSEDLDLRIPAGVQFVASNENVHFSSVVAFHARSATIHVDDTFSYLPLPKAASILGFREGTVQLHPTLAWALEPRAGAAGDFRMWMRRLLQDWEAKNLCCAHAGTLLEPDNTGASINGRLSSALLLVEPVLYTHDLLYGRGDGPAGGSPPSA